MELVINIFHRQYVDLIIQIMVVGRDVGNKNCYNNSFRKFYRKYVVLKVFIRKKLVSCRYFAGWQAVRVHVPKPLNSWRCFKSSEGWHCNLYIFPCMYACVLAYCYINIYLIIAY